MLPSSLLRWRVFSDFRVSGPSLDPIFLRFSRFGAPFLIRFGLHFAATAGAMFRHSAANMLHSTGWWGYAAREEFLSFSHQEPNKPDGSPKKNPSLPWTPPGPSENLENEPLDIEDLHFSCPIPIENTKEITENTGFCQPPRFRQNYVKICRF